MFERVKNILSEYCKDGVEITKESNLMDDLGLNSLILIELATEFEDEFDISIPDSEIPTIQTVGDILGLLETLGVNVES